MNYRPCKKCLVRATCTKICPEFIKYPEKLRKYSRISQFIWLVLAAFQVSFAISGRIITLSYHIDAYLAFPEIAFAFLHLIFNYYSIKYERIIVENYSNSGGRTAAYAIMGSGTRKGR